MSDMDGLSGSSASVPSGSESYRFEFEQSGAWLKHLNERGYVVVKSVLDAQNIETARDLIWRDIEAAEGVSRSDPETWSKWHVPSHGIVSNLAQTAGPWHIRGSTRVQKVFELVWKTPDLITSMDAVILWRPWWFTSDEGNSIPWTEGLHLDQNPFSKPDLDCIQGMVPLLPVTQEVGGLEVVPFSHTKESREKFMEDHPGFRRRGDFCMIPSDSPHGRGALLLEANAGDLILWDSRTVHGGNVGPGFPPAERTPPFQLARMSVTVAMTPRAWASESIQRHRKVGFEAGRAFNHCPHEAGTSTGTIHAKRKPGYHKFKLSKSQLAVL